MSQRRRVIDADENAMLTGVVQLNELKVRDIMVPRVDMIASELQDDPDDLRRIMGERHLPKLPVYDGDMDHIIGLVYAKDLFLDPDSEIEDILRPVRFIPEVVTLTQALHHFQQTRSQLAIVVDEHGGVVGLVTLEDVAEEIVGELTEPEAGEQEPDWERLGPDRFRVSGQLSIRDWAEQFHVSQFDPRVSTLGGYIVARLGHIPDVGDQVRIGNLQLTVETLHKRRVERVVVELVSQPPASNGEEVAR
jgi:CBS domain containing-hemolysin-like protein